jgi:hypothetical protein
MIVFFIMKNDHFKKKKTIPLIKNTFLSKNKKQIHEYRKIFD